MNAFKEEKELAKLFKVFSNKYRLAILKFLKNEGEKSVGQIADHLDVQFNAVSKNVLYLARRGLLTRRYDTPFVLYKISNSALESAKKMILEII